MSEFKTQEMVTISSRQCMKTNVQLNNSEEYFWVLDMPKSWDTLSSKA